MDDRVSLDAGDIVLVDFSPVVGHEQDGTRPAMVVSPRSYNDASTYVVICPITSNAPPWPFKIALPDGLGVTGYVLLDQVKSVDRRRRVLRILDKIPDTELAIFRAGLSRLFGMTAADMRL